MFLLTIIIMLDSNAIKKVGPSLILELSVGSLNNLIS
jgi:hypothetical protein